MLGLYAIGAGPTGSGGSSGSAVVLSVDVSPPFISLADGERVTFSATVRGEGAFSSDVQWAAVMGSISDAGDYVPPPAMSRDQYDSITVISKADPGIRAAATVRIMAKSTASWGCLLNPDQEFTILPELKPITPEQAESGKYAKDRYRLYGMAVAIESPRDSVRQWTAADGATGSQVMTFAYGYIEGTLGNDGDELDCFIGPSPLNAELVYVVNQYIDGVFDEHKIMFGFNSQEEAEAGYLGNYTPGWPGLGSCIACSTTQLRWWIGSGNKSRPLTQDQLPAEGTGTMEKVLWDSANMPLYGNLEQVLYRLRAHDGDEGLLYDAVSMADILADSDGVLTLDALVIPFARLEQRMGIMQKVLGRTGKNVKVAAMQVSDPFMQRGSANVAVIFELTDGQTVSVFFHNPDVTPKKLAAADELVSWKWMLNKKDITVAVAPEKGRDLEPRMVAARIMALAEKNSGRFVKANGKRAERLQTITSLQTELDTKKATLADLEQQVAAAEAAAEAAGRTDPEPVAPDPQPEPQPAPAAVLDVDGLKGVLAEVDPMSAVSHGSNWVIMNAPRPLMGTETMSNGEFLTGRFYAAIDPADDMASAYIAENVKLDARVVFIADATTQQGMALNTINPTYLPAYMGMDDDERGPALRGFIDKLNNRTIGELKALAAKGMPVLPQPEPEPQPQPDPAPPVVPAVDPDAEARAAKEAADAQEADDGDFLALAAAGNVDFFDKAVTDRLAALARKYTDPDGAYLDMIERAKTAAKNWFVAEFKKRVG